MQVIKIIHNCLAPLNVQNKPSSSANLKILSLITVSAGSLRILLCTDLQVYLLSWRLASHQEAGHLTWQVTHFNQQLRQSHRGSLSNLTTVECYGCHGREPHLRPLLENTVLAKESAAFSAGNCVLTEGHRLPHITHMEVTQEANAPCPETSPQEQRREGGRH